MYGKETHCNYMDNNKLLKLFIEAGKLKRIKRTGWAMKNIPCPESVADHSFRTSFIALILGTMLELNVEKLLKMSLLHDLPEIITGDITPHCGIPVTEKYEKEKIAIKKFNDIFPDNNSSIVDLWEEYESRNSPEARLLKNIDKLEMAIQAFEYQKQYPEIDLEEFINNAKMNINDPTILSIFKALTRQITGQRFSSPDFDCCQ